MAGAGDRAPSTNIRNLNPNLESLDAIINSDELTIIARETPDNPAGKVIRTIAGANADFDLAIAGVVSDGNATIAQIKSEGDAAIDALRIVSVGSFEDGGTITVRPEVLFYDAEKTYYRWDGALPKVVPAGSTPAGTGGVSDGAWVNVGQAELASAIANPAESGNRVARMPITAYSLKDLATAPRIANRQYSVKGFYAGSDVGGGMFYWDANRDKVDHNGGTVIDPDRVDAWDGTQGDLDTLFTTGIGSGCFVRFGIDRINPKMFGFTDDSDDHNITIIRETFHAAGELRIPVEFTGISELRLRIPDTPIRIYHDVDFQGCVLKMIDAVLPPEEVNWEYKTVFRVPPQREFTTIQPDQQTLMRGSVRIKTENGETLENGFYILRTERLLPPRSLGGVYYDPEKYIQAFAVYSGESTSGLALDVSNRADSYLQYRPFCEPVVIKGLSLDSSTFNNLKVLDVMRDNTRIIDVVSVGGSSKESINSTLSIRNCCNVTVDKFICPQNYNKGENGSYTIELTAVSDILFDNITSTGNPIPETWGAFGCSYVSNVTIRDSRLGRFDSHSGLFGRTVIEGCYFTGNSVYYGWGAGEINISTSKFVDTQGIVVQRVDYWGNFDGDIIINDCNIEITDNFNIPSWEATDIYGNIFVCFAIGRGVDPSYADEVIMCRRLIVRNVCVRRPKTGNPLARCHIFRLSTSTTAPQPTVDVYYPQYVEVDGLYADKEGGRVTFTCHVLGRYFIGHPDSQCVLRNVDNSSLVKNFLENGNIPKASCLFTTTDINYLPTTPVFSKVIIDGCIGVAGFTAETSDFLVTNSEILNWRFSRLESGEEVEMDVPINFINCKFNYAAPLPETLYSIQIPNKMARFYNCHFGAQFDYINTKSAIGCTFGAGITLTSQNAPADKGLWFTGFSEDTGWSSP